jgi:hypothetical protein
MMGKPSCIWENTFKMGLEDDDESHGVEWIRLAQDMNQ